MRVVCDVCEGAPAQLFCAADEAALCLKCDGKVHGCNKLASRHVRLELAEARAVPRCDICENAPAFFFCCVDGTSLCLQCDMDVHIAGKKTHERYLMMGQRVKPPKTPKTMRQDDLVAKDINENPKTENDKHHHQSYHRQHHEDNKAEEEKKHNLSGDWNNSDASAVAITVGDEDLLSIPNHRVSRMIDLNSRPAYLQRVSHVAKDQEVASSDDECAGVVPQTTRKSSDNSDY